MSLKIREGFENIGDKTGTLPFDKSYNQRNAIGACFYESPTDGDPVNNLDQTGGGNDLTEEKEGGADDIIQKIEGENWRYGNRLQASQSYPQ